MQCVNYAGKVNVVMLFVAAFGRRTVSVWLFIFCASYCAVGTRGDAQHKKCIVSGPLRVNE
jgi:hypothetical protein